MYAVRGADRKCQDERGVRTVLVPSESRDGVDEFQFACAGFTNDGDAQLFGAGIGQTRR